MGYTHEKNTTIDDMVLNALLIVSNRTAYSCFLYKSTYFFTERVHIVEVMIHKYYKRFFNSIPLHEDKILLNMNCNMFHCFTFDSDLQISLVREVIK